MKTIKKIKGVWNMSKILKAFGILSMVLLMMSPVAWAQQGAISVIPPGGSFKVGDKITAPIVMNTAGEKVTSVQVWLTIDPTMLEVADDPNNPGYPLIAIDSKFPMAVDPGTVSADKKTITIAAGVLGPAKAVSGTAVHFADITFNALKDGTAKVTFIPVQGANGTLALNAASTNIIGTYNSASYTIGTWKLTGKVGSFVLPIESDANGVLSLQSTGSNTFGFWYLDNAVVSPTADTLYRARYAIKSDQTDPSQAPTFRIRYNAANFMQGDFVQVNSNDAGEASPGTTEKIYDLYFRPQYDAVGVNGTLSFDMINIGNPTDAPIATLSLDYLQLDKKAIADLGTPTVVTPTPYTFTVGQGNWSNSDTLGPFTSPNYNWDDTELALTLVSTDTNTFGYWQNKQDDVAIDHNVLYQLRVNAASAAGGQPTMRARMYDHPDNQVNSSFQAPVWKAYEKPPSPPTMAISQLTYHDYFAYFHNKEGVGPYLGIAIDMINLDESAPADAKIAIREVELSTFAIPTF
jgi:hypothetical protein